MTGFSDRLSGPKLPPGNRAALVIATTSYRDASLRRLRSPATDVSNLADVLANQSIGNFIVRDIVDYNGQDLREEITDFLEGRSPDDTVLLYLSCHGILDNRRRLYFAATDTRKEKVRATGVPSSWLVECLDDCRARRQILILDCCFSGAFNRGLIKGEEDVGLEDVMRGRGRVVLTASNAREYAFEALSDELPSEDEPAQGSVFTSALIDGLRSGRADKNGNGIITVDDAYDYAYNQLRARGTAQTPQRFLSEGEGDIILALNPHGPTATGAHADGDEGPGASERDGWGGLRPGVADGALLNDKNLYVKNPQVARAEILRSIRAQALIPALYHYSSDALADLWVIRAAEPAYKHQRNTLNFWTGPEGRDFASRVRQEVGSSSFDFVSLGPGDGQKDVQLISGWLDADVDLIYYPYDISWPLAVRSYEAARSRAIALGKADLLRVKVVLADFHDLGTVRDVFRHRSAPNVVSLMGTLGNLEGEMQFLRRLRDNMDMQDLLILEVRLQSQATPTQLAAGGFFEQSFGPLEEYLGMTFTPSISERMRVSVETELSDIPNTHTLVITYAGPVPGLRGDQKVKLEYVHLYEPDSFLRKLEDEGFSVRFSHVSYTNPRFLECLVRRSAAS